MTWVQPSAGAPLRRSAVEVRPRKAACAGATGFSIERPRWEFKWSLGGSASPQLTSSRTGPAGRHWHHDGVLREASLWCPWVYPGKHPGQTGRQALCVPSRPLPLGQPPFRSDGADPFRVGPLALPRPTPAPVKDRASASEQFASPLRETSHTHNRLSCFPCRSCHAPITRTAACAIDLLNRSTPASFIAARKTSSANLRIHLGGLFSPCQTASSCHAT